MTFAPLRGLRVLDLSRLLPGPFLTSVLHELGADVVKIEEPGAGDPARGMEPDVFAALNRGKRSLVVDLKRPGAAEVLTRLAQRADVLVESFRPGVLDRLGLSDATLERQCPRLVRASLVGYPRGPMRDEVGHDINYVALAGILDAQGVPDRPMLAATQVADVGGALYGAVGVLAALLERDRTGRGRRVEVALSDAALALHAAELHRIAAGGASAPGGGPLTGGLARYGVYACADGAWLALGALEPKFWERFRGAAGVPEDADAGAVARAVASRPRAEWLDQLRRAGVPATAVLTAREALAHPNAARLGGAPTPGAPLTHASARGDAPALGADADAVLREAGYDEAGIADLRERGIVA